MSNNKLATKYFYGNEISAYGQENGFLDYATFVKAFDAVLNNNIMEKGWGIGNGWELVNGSDYDEETEEYTEVYQWYIVSDSGARIIEEWTDEILYYHEELDIYLWGITHFGTSWEYVLMDIPCNCGYDKIQGSNPYILSYFLCLTFEMV